MRKGLQELGIDFLLPDFTGIRAPSPVIEDDDRPVRNQRLTKPQRFLGRRVDVAIHQDQAGLVQLEPRDRLRRQRVPEPPLDEVHLAGIDACPFQILPGGAERRGILTGLPALTGRLARHAPERIEADQPDTRQSGLAQRVVQAGHRCPAADAELEIVPKLVALCARGLDREIATGRKLLFGDKRDPLEPSPCTKGPDHALRQAEQPDTAQDPFQNLFRPNGSNEASIPNRPQSKSVPPTRATTLSHKGALPL